MLQYIQHHAWPRMATFYPHQGLHLHHLILSLSMVLLILLSLASLLSFLTLIHAWILGVYGKSVTPATLSIFVTVTHFRSPDYALPGDNGGWCNSFLVPTSTLSRPCFLRPPGTRPELPPLPSVGYPAKGVAACRVGSTIPLSTDHEPDRSDERQTIEDAGGFVIWAGIWRVGGVLSVSCAFGDELLKASCCCWSRDSRRRKWWFS